MIELPYTPQPRQQLAHIAKASEVFYGGSAGSGKSAYLRWDAVDFCINCPKLFAMLFRRKFTQLQNNQIRPLQLALPSQVAEWNESRKEFRFFNGSILTMKHMEHEQDIDDIQGLDIHYAGIDEAAQFTPYQLAYIRSRMRLGDYRGTLEKLISKTPRLRYYLERLPRLTMASNPGGEAHQYLKDNYITPAPPEVEHVGEDGISRIFIPARMPDNKYIDANYEKQFDELPAWQRDQLVNGDWDAVSGAYFDCFRRDEHVIQPFSIPHHWTKFRGFDWGFHEPFACGWLAVADGTPVMDRNGDQLTFEPGTLIVYREWYGAIKGKRGWTNRGIRLDPEAVGRGILERETGEEVAYGVADPSCWRSDGGPSVAERMVKAGVVWQKAANEREAGSQALYQRLKRKTLYFFDTCENLIRTIPLMIVDDKKPESYTKMMSDHCVDFLRYSVMTRPAVTERKKRVSGILLPTLDDLMKGQVTEEQPWL